MKQQSEWQEVRGNNVLEAIEKLDQNGLKNHIKKLTGAKCALVLEGPDV